MKEKLSEEKQLYFELFELYKKRLKTKHLTYEAYLFERESAKNLSIASMQLMKHIYDVSGYFKFKVYHPQREINAPMYIDRIIEQWFVEKYIQPVYEDRLYKYNMACQSGKGPFLAMDYLKEELNRLYSIYGLNFCVFQYDIEGYFDNIAHNSAKDMMRELENNLWIYERIVDSFSVPESYSSMADKDNKYGFPKGTLPSQWTGIILLNDLDWLIHDDKNCLANYRYMDDGLNFFRTIEQCKHCKDYTENFLRENKLGIRLHSKKTYYAPITRGFTFCGWRYTLDEDGTIHIRIRNSKKKEMEHRLKVISQQVKKGKMSLKKANAIRDGMFEYLSHGTESKKLIKYMRRQYPFPKYEKGK